MECVVVEIYFREESIVIYNFYNPCKKISIKLFEKIRKETKELWCGDFNAHNWLWGSKNTDYNGEVIEQFMDDRSLVCLNTGEGTRYNLTENTVSSIDLTLISNGMAELCEWKVNSENTVGSDHFPIICKINVNSNPECFLQKKWMYEKADWNSFSKHCETNKDIVVEDSVETFCDSITKLIMEAATLFIPQRIAGQKNKNIPWWKEECSKAIKERNKTFKQLRENMSMSNLVEYKKARAKTRRIIKNAKREGWREFCSTIGKDTPMDKIWNMLRNMSGKGKKSTLIPVLIEEDKVAVIDINKANMLGEVLERAHRIELGEEYELRKREILDKNPDIMKKRNNNNSCMDTEFTLTELKVALQKCANTASGVDRVSYKMIKHLSDSILLMILELYNKIWMEGIIPKIWKKAVVIPIVKPGKNPTNPGSYRPIALTSNLCKLMEKIIVHRLTYDLEKKGKLSKYQCGFRGKRSTMDALIKVSNEVEKAVTMKKIMAVVYFDIEKAYDTVWREGLLIKASRIGIDGKMYNWLSQFLFERIFVVQVGACQSSIYKAENGIP